MAEGESGAVLYRALLLADAALRQGLLDANTAARALDTFRGTAPEEADGFTTLLAEIADVSADARKALEDEVKARVEAANGDEVLALLASRPTPRPGSGSSLSPLSSQRYSGFRRVGKGGMGIVYVAVDRDLNREVAFKIIRPRRGSSSLEEETSTPLSLTPPEPGTKESDRFAQRRERFLTEARITGLMEHPGIVPVHELGETATGIPAYTMRYVRGKRTLATELAPHRHAEFAARRPLLEVFLRVCDTVHYAHSQGVIHRDLKPLNIGIGEYGETVVLDWGLARLRDRPDLAETAVLDRITEYRKASDVPASSIAHGTPGYLPPEAALGRVALVDARSDVYSLGVILFEILTGRLPFAFTTFGEYVAQVTNQDAPRADQIDELVPLELATLCASALDREPERRPESAGELADAVRAWQARRELKILLTQLDEVLAKAEASKGARFVQQVDAASQLVLRARQLAPDDPEVAERLEWLGFLQERALRARTHQTMRRLLLRAAAVLVLALGVTGALVGRALHAGKVRAENAREEAEVAEGRAKAHLANAYANLAREFSRKGRHAAAHLAAARAVATAPESRECWAGLAYAGRRPLATSKLLGAGIAVGSALGSPDEKTLYVGDAEGRLIAWDLDSGEQVLDLKVLDGPVQALTFAGEPPLLYCGGNAVVRSVDPVLGRTRETIEGFDGEVHDLAYAPSRGLLLVRDVGAAVHVVDLASGQSVWRIRGPRDYASFHMRVSPDEQYVLVGTSTAITAWNLDTRRPVRVLPIEDAELADIAFAADGRKVYAATYRDEEEPRGILAWSWPEGIAEAPFGLVEGGYQALVVSGELRRILAARRTEPEVRAWDVGNVRALPATCPGEAPLVVLPGRRWLVVNDELVSLRIRSAATGLEELAALRPGHAGSVMALGTTADRKRMISVCAGGMLRVWDLEASRLDRPPIDLDTPPDVFALSPTDPDVYAVGAGLTVTIHKLGQKKPLRVLGPVEGHTELVRALCLAPDGERMYVGLASGTVLERDIRRGKEKAFRYVGSHGGPVRALVLSADGRILYSGGGVPGRETDDTVLVWNVEEQRQVARLSGHDGAILTLALAADGERLFSGGWDRTIRIWDTWSHQSLATIRAGKAPVSVLLPSPDGRLLYAGFDTAHPDYASISRYSTKPLEVRAFPDEPCIRVWDLERGELVAAYDGHRGGVVALALSADQKRLYSAGSVDHAIVVNSLSVAPSVASLVGSGSPTFCLDLDRDDARLFTGTGRVGGIGDSKVLAWRVGGKEAPVLVDTSPSGCSTADGRSMVLDPETGRICSGEWYAHTGAPDPCGERTETSDAHPETEEEPLQGPGEPLVNVYDPNDEPRLEAVLTTDAPGDYDSVLDMAVGAGRLYAGGRSGTVYEFNLRNLGDGRALRKLPQRGGPASAVAVHTGAVPTLYVGTRSGRIHVWDLRRDQLVRTLDAHAGGVGSLLLSADGRRLVSAGGGRGILEEEADLLATTDTTVKIWDAESGRVLRTLRGHSHFIEALAWSSDETLLFSGSRDGTIRVWNVETGSPVAILDGDNGAVRAIDVSGGLLLYSGGHSTEVLEWDLGAFLEDPDRRLERLRRATHLRLDGSRIERRPRNHFRETVLGTLQAESR